MAANQTAFVLPLSINGHAMDYKRQFDACLLTFSKQHGPEQWHGMAAGWNYEIGNSALLWIVAQKNCYLATVLKLYWDYLLRYSLGMEKIPEYHRAEFEQYQPVKKEIEKKMHHADFYPDERYDFEIPRDKFDLESLPKNLPKRLLQDTEKKQEHRRLPYYKCGLPEEVIETVLGEEVRRIESSPKVGGPKYWFFMAETRYYRNKPANPEVVSAKYEENGQQREIQDSSAVVGLLHQISSPAPWPDREYTFVFEVDKRWSHPDYYGTGYGQDCTLHSARLIKLLQENGLQFKPYPVELVDREGQQVSGEYYLVKLAIPVIDALNEYESLWTGILDVGYKRLVLDEHKVQGEPMIALEKQFKRLMSDELVQSILANKITGFRLLPSELYCHGVFGRPLRVLKDEWVLT